MAVTATPIFVQTPKSVHIALTATANTNTDGTTGTYTTIFTSGANGSKVERIRFNTVGTTVAEKARLFIGGKLYDEYLIAAVTPSNTVKIGTYDIDFTQPGAALIIAASTAVICNVNTGTSALIHVHVFYADF